MNNDLTSAAFNLAGITFNAGSPAYTIGGNAFTLTGNITNNSTSSLQTINDAMTLSAGAHVFSAATGGSLTLGGNITGANVNASALASGGGTITLGGTNSLTTTGGNTYALVTGGSTLAITGATTFTLGSNDYIAIGSGSGGALTVASGAVLNVSGGNNGLYIGVFSGGAGTLNVNGTLNLASTTPLNVAGYSATSGTVNLNVGGTIAIGSGIVGSVGGGSGISTFVFNGGTLKATAAGGGAMSGITTVTAAASTVSNIDSNGYSTSLGSVISGSGALKILDGSGANSGLVSLNGNNSYSGGTTLTSGGLQLNAATGAGSGTITLAGGALIDNANFNNALNVTGSVIVANQSDDADGSHSGALSGAGTLTVGSVTVGGSTHNPASSFKYNGSLGGFTGTFVDNTSTNVIFQSAAVAGSASAKFQINGGAFYANQAGSITTLNLGELSGSSAGGVNLFGLALSEGALNTSSTYAGALANLSLTKVGTGTLTLSGLSTYSAGTSITAGGVQLNNTSGAGTGSIAVGASGVLALNYNDVQANTITGSGVISTFNASGNNIVLSGSMSGFNGTINVGSAGGTAGKTVVSIYATSDPGLTSGTAINVANGGTLYDYGIAVPSTINVSGTGNAEGLGAIRLEVGATLSGTVNLLGDTTVGNNNGSSGTYGTISGVVSGSGFGLIKVAPYAIILSNANTYTGATSVVAGTLLVNGSTAGGSAVTVTNSGSTLGGGGTVAGGVTINAGANLSPGKTVAAGATAKLATGALTLASGSNLLIDVANYTAGTGYDQVNTTGAVSLNGCNLTVTVNGSGLSMGQKLFILDNGSSSAISGTFSGLANNATFTSGSDTFRINYFDTGDSTSGNDVSLSVVAVPEPATWVVGALSIVAALLGRRRRCQA